MSAFESLKFIYELVCSFTYFYSRIQVFPKQLNESSSDTKKVINQRFMSTYNVCIVKYDVYSGKIKPKKLSFKTEMFTFSGIDIQCRRRKTRRQANKTERYTSSSKKEMRRKRVGRYISRDSNAPDLRLYMRARYSSGNGCMREKTGK